jgi:hypothetical protein
VVWSGLGQVESSCECGNELSASIKCWDILQWVHSSGRSSGAQLGNIHSS